MQEFLMDHQSELPERPVFNEYGLDKGSRTPEIDPSTRGAEFFYNLVRFEILLQSPKSELRVVMATSVSQPVSR